jgi:serine kinase of HPr protein (carbohydrate metabolism regulator)
MTVAQLVEKLGLEVLTGNTNMDREVKTGYTSDLLSDAIAGIGDDAVWITIQRHINVLGVAKLKDVSAIIIPRNLQLEKNVTDKAQEEHIAILRCPQSAFEISALVYNVLTRN